MRTCLAMCVSLWLTLPASAESRAGTYTPQQLHDQSTVVFEGTVTRMERVARYGKAFPVRAKVAAVLKGKLDGKDVSFRYKSPGKYVIFEAEFNKPEVGQKGTFYLKDFSGTLVLIGYIAKPATAPAVAARGFRVVVDGPLIEKGGWWKRAVFTRDGRRIFHGGAVYDAKTGALLRRIKGCADISAVSPDGKTVAFRVGGHRGPRNLQEWHGVSVASMETARVLKTVEIVDHTIQRISFPSPRRVVAGAVPNMYVIDPQLGRVIRVDKRADYRVTAISPDGKHYAKLHIVFPRAKDGLVKALPSSLRFFVTIHDLNSGKETARLGEAQGFAEGMMWTPDGKHIIVTTRQSQMHVFHVPTRKLLAIHISRWAPAFQRQMVGRRFLMLLDNNSRNAFLDLKMQDIIPLNVPAKGKTRIVAISPDGTRAVVTRYQLPAGRVLRGVYLARLSGPHTVSPAATRPAAGGTPVKGLRVSLTQPKTPKDKIPPDMPPEVKGHVERLYSSDTYARIKAIWALERMEHKAAPAVPFLVELLADNTEYTPAVPTGRGLHVSPRHMVVHREAARALEKIGAPARSALRRASKEAEMAARVRAARVLVLMGEKKAIEIIAAAVRDKRPGVRFDAASFLLELGDPRATEPLVAFLDDKHRGGRALQLLRVAQDPRANARLIAMLSDPNTHLARESILRAISGPARGRLDLRPILEALRCDRPFTRGAAAGALGRMKDPRALPALLAAFKDKSGYVRACVAAALGRIDAKRAVEPLIEALEGDADEDVRRYAAKSLGQIADPRAFEPLVAALKDEDFHVCEVAASALGALGDPRAIPQLVPLLSDRYRSPREGAAGALIRIGRPAVEALTAALGKGDSQTPAWAAYALGKIGDRRAIGPLVEAAEKARRRRSRWVLKRTAEALKGLTGRDFGENTVRWRVWWNRNKPASQPARSTRHPG